MPLRAEHQRRNSQTRLSALAASCPATETWTKPANDWLPSLWLDGFTLRLSKQTLLNTGWGSSGEVKLIQFSILDSLRNEYKLKSTSLVVPTIICLTCQWTHHKWERTLRSVCLKTHLWKSLRHECCSWGRNLLFSWRATHCFVLFMIWLLHWSPGWKIKVWKWGVIWDLNVSKRQQTGSSNTNTERWKCH